MTARTALVLGAIAMFLAVALGAFGAHALRARLPPDLLAVWQTAVQYHAWHGLALLGIGWWLRSTDEPRGRHRLAAGAWLLVAGIALFSGSLYVLALTGLTGLGRLTPFGGIAWLAAWVVIATAAWRSEGAASDR